jgi:hypothetical protein
MWGRGEAAVFPNIPRISRKRKWGSVTYTLLSTGVQLPQSGTAQSIMRSTETLENPRMMGLQQTAEETGVVPTLS